MKEKKALLCCVIVLFLMVALSIAGCSGGSNGTGDPKKPAGNQGTNNWPADIPGYVPLPDGDVSEIKEAKKTEEYAHYYIITFKNMKDTADSYEKKLISNGWDIVVATDLGSIWSINANYNSGQAYITVTWEEDEKEGTFALGVVR